MNWAQRKVYISGLVDTQESKQKRTSSDTSRRKYSNAYHLIINGERRNVCKAMFLNTLGLKEAMVRKWCKDGLPKEKMHPSSAFRTQRPTSRKKKLVQEFLDELSKLPSHYCRQSSSKEYLEEGIRDMPSLYKLLCEWCNNKSEDIPCITVLRREFKKKNLGFFQPKKDQCDTCVSHKTGNITDEIYNAHIIKKNRAQAEKKKDKDEATAQDSVWTMDVQAVLISPRLFASAHYYKTKLACHNFTMYNLQTGKVLCYFFTEVEADLSANTFATCVRDCLADVLDDNAVTRIILYSDGCGYQNRNSTLSNALLEFSIAHKIVIEQKYLEQGHTQMEVDSVHSVIEKKLRGREVFFPGDYVQAMKEARPTKPYIVKELSYDFAKDFSQLKFLDSIRPGRKAGEPLVHQLRALRYLPTGKVDFKIDFSDEYTELPQRVRPFNDTWEIRQLHMQRLKIKQTKFQHLQQLKQAMNTVYHSYYDNLPH